MFKVTFVLNIYALSEPNKYFFTPFNLFICFEFILFSLKNTINVIQTNRSLRMSKKNPSSVRALVTVWCEISPVHSSDDKPFFSQRFLWLIGGESKQTNKQTLASSNTLFKWRSCMERSRFIQFLQWAWRWYIYSIIQRLFNWNCTKLNR